MSMSSQFISIIVPVYNAQATLERACASLQAQTYTHTEIILVNDGSTDDSGGICDSFALRNANARVIHEANGGVGSARNCGLAEASGDYVMFVDSDDHIEPVMLEEMAALTSDMSVDMVLCGYTNLRTIKNGNILPVVFSFEPGAYSRDAWLTILNQKTTCSFSLLYGQSSIVER